MDIVDCHLATCAANKDYAPSLRGAFALGKKLMNKYYSLSNCSEVYHIAIILHPRRKLSYFKKADWPDHWVAAAQTIIEEEFVWSYADYQPSAKHREHQTSAGATSCSSVSVNMFDASDSDESDHRLEDKDHEHEIALMLDELQKYLLEKVEKVKDPLQWWAQHKNTYPR
ncbi:hypothetical protein H1R20_g7824, partial [Candolleomyces eurysporus]